MSRLGLSILVTMGAAIGILLAGVALQAPAAPFADRCPPPATVAAR